MHTPLVRCALETERFVAAGGWDQPPRLFALVSTTRLVEAEPQLGGSLDASDPDAISSVEQDGLPQVESLEHLLGHLGWPPEVDGVALAVERIVVSPEAESELPADPDEAMRALAEHPSRTDVRLLVAVLRDGETTCLLRQRSHDSDDDVAIGQEIAPGLLDALKATLIAD